MRTALLSVLLLIPFTSVAQEKPAESGVTYSGVVDAFNGRAKAKAWKQALAEYRRLIDEGPAEMYATYMKERNQCSEELHQRESLYALPYNESGTYFLRDHPNVARYYADGREHQRCLDGTDVRYRKERDYFWRTIRAPMAPVAPPPLYLPFVPSSRVWRDIVGESRSITAIPQVDDSPLFRLRGTIPIHVPTPYSSGDLIDREYEWRRRFAIERQLANSETQRREESQRIMNYPSDTATDNPRRSGSGTYGTYGTGREILRLSEPMEPLGRVGRSKR